MREELIKAFPHSCNNDCIKVYKESEFIVYDDTISGKCLVNVGDINQNQRPYFKIVNPNNKEITIVSIDNCILFSNDGKKCDFACFDESEFYFVELKLAFGGQSSRRSCKKHALLQLKETINAFTAIMNFTGYKKFACSCVGYNKTTPASPASDLNTRLDFLINYNTHLIQGDEITFN